MFKFDINNYINNIAETPKEYYNNLLQATINTQWENTTQLYTVKEQLGLPFVDCYEEYEAWVDNVSDNLVNTSKNYSDFVTILFKDIDHKQNYKGQYYKINLDGNHEEIYLCYDRINKLGQTSDFKCVRCNNVLTFVDAFGKPIEIPCYLGEDISSTNNLISKDGITPNSRMVIFAQYNEYTKSIQRNQRFMFEHSTAFKVEEVNNYIQEEGTDGQVTFVKIYIDFSAILPQDNKELNLCNYNLDYSIFIKEEPTISVEPNGDGTFAYEIFDKDKNNIELPIIWKSSDENVVIIDQNGYYKIVGNSGDKSIITVCLKDNETIKDEVEIYVSDEFEVNQSIIVLPNDIKELFENQSIEFKCAVYFNGDKQNKPIGCIGSGADVSKYDIEETLEGYKVTSLGYSKIPLTLTFTCDGYPNTEFDIKLKRAL